MSGIARLWAGFLILLLAGNAWGIAWDQDMVDQPSAKPQESEAPPDPGAVPVSGNEDTYDPRDEAEQFAAKDAAVSIANPVPATPESIARGEAFYAIHCVVCHGEDGKGAGTVGLKFEKSPADLNEAYTQDQADGQLFYTLTRGRADMPYYRDALSQPERWDVVNFVKSEFGYPPGEEPAEESAEVSVSAQMDQAGNGQTNE